MSWRIMGKQSRRSFVGMAVFLWAVFSLSSGDLLWGADEKSSEAQKAQSDEREKAMQESILNAKKEMLSGEDEADTGGEEMPEKSTQGLLAKEETAFSLAENIRWEADQDKASLEILGEEETLPTGAVEASPDGRSVRWRPDQPVVVMKKKDNPVESPFLQRIIFREDVVMTKKLELAAPYYALSEIELMFSAAVSYNVTQEGARIFFEFSPTMKPAEEDEEEIQKPHEIPTPKMETPYDLLGNFYQQKEIYETYLLGGDQAKDVMKTLRAGRSSAGLFDGRGGFPREMKTVFKEAYPAFGTPEYWKRHVRAAVNNIFGFSSNFAGTYGAGGVSTKDKAFTLQPNVNIVYNGLGFARPLYGTKPPTGSFDLGYSASRMLPLGSRDLAFGDGGRGQSINWGGSYVPKKPYSMAWQNKLSLFATKGLSQTNGEWLRNARHGYGLTTAGGINYRLTRRMLWKNGIGIGGTQSLSPNGRSHDVSGYLNTGVTQVLSRRARLDTDYTFRHLFSDTGSSGSSGDTGSPSTGPGLKTKGKDIHAMTMKLEYRISRNLTFGGGPELSVVDGTSPAGDVFAFGGGARLGYRWGPKDALNIIYGNGLISDGTGKIMSGLLGRNPNNTAISLGRGTQIGINYGHKLKSGGLGLSLNYRQLLPLDGIFPRQTTKTDFISFQASWSRKLRGGRSSLELSYRYTSYLSKGIAPAEKNEVSTHEHAVLLTMQNYFGA